MIQNVKRTEKRMRCLAMLKGGEDLSVRRPEKVSLIGDSVGLKTE